MKLILIKTSLFFLLIVSSFSAWAGGVKLGKIDAKLLEMSVYEKDSSAVAVILDDYGRSYYDFESNVGTSQLMFTRVVRIKILKKEGLKWADWEIGLYRGKSSEEKLLKVRGYTYNLVDGKVEKTKFDGKVHENDVHSRYYKEKFSFSNVKVGSVIDLEYTIMSPYITSIPDWYFQSSIPVVHSEYIVEMPEVYSFQKRVNGYVTMSEVSSSTYQKDISIKVEYLRDGYSAGIQTGVERHSILVTKDVLIANDVPAFDGESYISSKENYISKVEYQFTAYNPKYGRIQSFSSTWIDMNENLLKEDDFGKLYSKKKRIYSIIQPNVEIIKENNESKKGQMIAAFELVKKQMKWTGMISIYPNNSLDDAYGLHEGNCADINLILLVYLRALDIESYPLVTKVRSDGNIVESSNRVRDMNYTMVYAIIDDKDYVLDASEDDLAAGYLPKRAMNNMAWLVDEQKYGWVDLQANLNSRSVEMISASLNEDGSIVGKLQCSYSGYEGAEIRGEINSFDSKENYILDLSKDWPDAEFINFDISNLDDPYQPIKEDIEVKLSNSTILSGDFIYLNPMLFHPISENPFKNEERLYPVEFLTKENKTYILNLSIPEGYVVDEFPKNEKVVLPENTAEFTYTCQQVGQTIQVIVKFRLNKTIYYSDEYTYLREFYNHVIQKHSNQIILKKA